MFYIVCERVVWAASLQHCTLNVMQNVFRPRCIYRRHKAFYMIDYQFVFPSQCHVYIDFLIRGRLMFHSHASASLGKQSEQAATQRCASAPSRAPSSKLVAVLAAAAVRVCWRTNTRRGKHNHIVEPFAPKLFCGMSPLDNMITRADVCLFTDVSMHVLVRVHVYMHVHVQVHV